MRVLLPKRGSEFRRDSRLIIAAHVLLAGAASKRVVCAFVSTLCVAPGLLLLASVTGDRLICSFSEGGTFMFYRSHSMVNCFD
jgi:hypothetical protein